MVARIILPAFGGSPAVWTTSMVFFQAVLLGGYAYAHYSNKILGPRRQSLIHIPLMLLALLTLPFTTHVSGGAVGGGTSLVDVLKVLFGMVGAVFFTVSAGAPLLQRWFAATDDPLAKDPYFLYSASNFGSMIALFSYPLLIEPRFLLSEQTQIWRFGYVFLIVMVVASATVLMRKKTEETGVEETVASTPPILASQRAMWVLLGAVPSSLLLGVTAYLTTNVAPIPLLWVVPLALYLVTFILAFSTKKFATAAGLSRFLPMLLTPLALAVILESSNPLIPLALFHLASFFVAAWMCHARLSETRPDPKHLTEFYLWMSVGGVVGGIFNAALAPMLFTTLAEYPIALVAAAGLRLPRRSEDSGFTALDAAYPVALGFVTFLITALAKVLNFEPSPGRTMVAIGIPAIACFVAVDRPKRYALSLGAVFLAAFAMHTASSGTVLYTARSFFGVHRVWGTGSGYQMHELVHGTTTHGKQNRTHPEEPLTYYTKSGPIGHVFKEFSGPNIKQEVALVGLGVGSLAAYGQPNQHMTFFEIDPVVRDIASNPKYFTYLQDSKAKVDIVMGDARLTLAQASDKKFGLIVLDAFSSDAIPIHLLTEDAVKMYLTKLDEHGVLALHISNRFLALSPMVGAIARDLHLQGLEFDDSIVVEEETDAGKSPSMWVILARSKKEFGKMNKDSNWSPLEAPQGLRAWTDDFSNILGSFKNNPD